MLTKPFAFVLTVATSDLHMRARDCDRRCTMHATDIAGAEEDGTDEKTVLGRRRSREVPRELTDAAHAGPGVRLRGRRREEFRHPAALFTVWPSVPSWRLLEHIELEAARPFGPAGELSPPEPQKRRS